MVAKTAAFGRGGASPALLEQQLGRLGRGTAPKELLLPAKYRGPEGAVGAGAAAGGADAELVAALTARTGGASDEDGDGESACWHVFAPFLCQGDMVCDVAERHTGQGWVSEDARTPGNTG